MSTLTKLMLWGLCGLSLLVPGVTWAKKTTPTTFTITLSIKAPDTNRPPVKYSFRTSSSYEGNHQDPLDPKSWTLALRDSTGRLLRQVSGTLLNYVFTDPGTYRITASVATKRGAVATTTEQIEIGDNQRPTFKPMHVRWIGKSPGDETYEILAEAHDPDGRIRHYALQIGDASFNVNRVKVKLPMATPVLVDAMVIDNSGDATHLIKVLTVKDADILLEDPRPRATPQLTVTPALDRRGLVVYFPPVPEPGTYTLEIYPGETLEGLPQVLTELPGGVLQIPAPDQAIWAQTFRSALVNQVGQGPWSPPITKAVLPVPTPPALRLTQEGLQLTWTPPPSPMTVRLRYQLGAQLTDHAEEYQGLRTDHLQVPGRIMGQMLTVSLAYEFGTEQSAWSPPVQLRFPLK